MTTATAAFWMVIPVCPQCKRPMKHRIVEKADGWQAVWECRRHPKAAAA